jgi:two-component system sensor histidine kinase PhoQ
VLDRSFTSSVEAGAQEQLRLVVYGLMGIAEESGDQLVFPELLPEPRLSQPESGLYAAVQNADGQVIWSSPSLQTSEIDLLAFSQEDVPGTFLFEQHGKQFDLKYSVIWEAANESLFSFRVMTDSLPFRAEIKEFRRNLTIGLVAATVLFVFGQFVAVGWGLRPIRLMENQVRELEAGTRKRLGVDFPPELQGLAANLDRFVEHEENNRTRYRVAMEDLAHSLKTPLAVVGNELQGKGSANHELIQEQLNQMQNTVRYQLSRASSAKSSLITGKVELSGIITRMVSAISKAYANKHTDVEVEIDSALGVRVNESDLMEILGNLIENAFKYGKSRIRIQGQLLNQQNSTGEPAQVMLSIEDDGPGIKPAMREAVLTRGTRADTVTAGQGIGLSVVVDLLAIYGGSLDIQSGELGGALMCVHLPA